jgi:tight adherence protein B
MAMTTMQTVMLGAGVLSVLLMLIAAMSGPSANKLAAQRLEGIKERYSANSSVTVQAQLRKIVAHRQTKLDDVMSQFIPRPALLRERIMRTGKKWTLPQYMMASGGLSLLVSLVLMISGMPFVFSIIAGFPVGLGVPHMVVNSFIKRRVHAFTVKFPDAIDLLVRGLRSGLPISETIGLVAQEVPGPVGFEFRNIADKIRIGRTMDAALQETADRLGTPEFQFFCISINIQRETGGNLAETLSNLADVLRKRSQMKLKIKAMSSESKASAYIVGALPFIVFGLIWFINDSYMQGFFHEQRLMLIGAGGLVWMAIGAGIMAKMISFEI